MSDRNAHELLALQAVMTNDEGEARKVMADMTPEALHELWRVCLVTIDLARQSILGPADHSDADPVVRAHRLVAELEGEPDGS